MISIIYYKIHSGKTNNLVQLVPAFVDTSKTGHECAYFFPTILDTLGKVPANDRYFGFGKVWRDFLRDKEYLFAFHLIHNISEIGCKITKKKINPFKGFTQSKLRFNNKDVFMTFSRR